MTVQIRTAEVQDIDAIQILNQEIIKDNTQYDDDLIIDWSHTTTAHEYFLELLKDPDSLCLVAEVDQKVVGFIAAAKKDFGYRKSKYLEIEKMGVTKEYQSQGVGSMLINKLKELAKNKGYDKLFVNSYFKNSQAIKFYKRSGFKEIDVSLEINLSST